MKSVVEVARLFKVCGKIEGRVKLQKIVHILQEAGFPFREEFGYLHHGPYSSDLKREIDQLCDWKLVEEESGSVINYTQYVYTPREELSDVLTKLGVESEPDWSELARDLNRKASGELEAISTILFLMRRGFGGERLQNRFVELKPHLKDWFEPCFKEASKLRETTEGRVA